MIHNPENLGFARCYQIALARAEKDHFIFLPGDHEIAAQSVREIFASVGRADVVVPYIQNHQARAWHRRVMSRVCVFLSNRVSGFKLKYYQGPAVYPTALARRLPTSTSGLFMLTEMLVHALKEGYSFVEVGLVHQQREYGRSKAVSLGSILMAAKTIALLWLNVRLTAVRPGGTGSGLTFQHLDE